MKKSKIIIPALALLAFSTAASVTGAVAWFTANRTATINAGSYSVVKTNTNLEFELAPGVGTSVSGNTVTFDGKLTDGSFNHKTQKVYTPNADGKELAPSPKGEIDLNGTYTASGTGSLADLLTRGQTDDTTPITIYTAVTFEIKFSVTFGVVPGDVGLYLDNTTGKSQFVVDGDPAPTAVTATGFRMAFVPKGDATATNPKAKVFADLQDKSRTVESVETQICKYIASSSDTTLQGTPYADSDYDLIDKNWDDDLPTSSTTRANAIARPDYLGVFEFDANEVVDLEFTVVAWFEGTDPNVVNQDDIDLYQTVISTLCFEAINLND